MDNEKFLMLLCLSLSLLIGALLHTITLQRKEFKAMQKHYVNKILFIDTVLSYIHTNENVNVKKYIDDARKIMEEKGGEENE